MPVRKAGGQVVMNSNLLNTEERQKLARKLSKFFKEIWGGEEELLPEDLDKLADFILADRKATKERVLDEVLNKLGPRTIVLRTMSVEDTRHPEVMESHRKAAEHNRKVEGWNEALAATRKAIEEVRGSHEQA